MSRFLFLVACAISIIAFVHIAHADDDENEYGMFLLLIERKDGFSLVSC
jgi:hypothetical protein